MVPSGKAIGLFGGTFDPVHIGHIAVAQSYLNSGFINELWVILTPVPPHKTGQQLSPFPIRKKMLEEAFRDMDKVIISDVETKLPEPSYTIQTIKYLQRLYEGHKFYLCIGEDSLVNFKKWHKWKEILTRCELLVAHRPGSKRVRIDPDVDDRTHFIDHNPVEVASSKLRENIKKGENTDHLIPEAVLRVIREYNLYCK